MTKPNKTAVLIAAAVAILFGALTILSGGRALFGSAEARAAVGNAVPFVLWFNFLAGLAYVMAGVGLWFRQRWSMWLSFAIVAATFFVFAAFGVQIRHGGGYKSRGSRYGNHQRHVYFGSTGRIWRHCRCDGAFWSQAGGPLFAAPAADKGAHRGMGSADPPRTVGRILGDSTQGDCSPKVIA